LARAKSLSRSSKEGSSTGGVSLTTRRRLARRARILRAGEENGEGGAKNDAERNDVIIGDPLAKLGGASLQRPPPHRARQNFLWSPAELFVDARADANPDLALVAERYDNASADLHATGELRSNAVSERLKERSGRATSMRPPAISGTPRLRQPAPRCA